MKALKIIGIVLLTLVVILGIAVVLQPSQAHIEKSIVIDAPAEAIFPEVSQFKNFTAWSPWSKMDPEVKQTFEGEPGTVGSKMNWDGPKTGQGSQVIEAIDENKSVKCSLTFGGYDGKFYSEFILAPEGNGTKVTWTYDGANDGFGAKAMWLVMGSMMKGQYEEGLMDLKKLVEAKPAVEPIPADSTVQTQ
ncbi:SRPBCC family protein [Chryseolinea lacunae]|uniref:SRPBCC family protein n=1 Tax=Chryseolinea lacunae TaxID=2801331 RepID=A0ABS1L3N6_9BACT|nr:SRPBCC family protein [Chryseolinea lacunae]MBL0745176.1 SRPBCC family protein [Chryseolinea lacunae]